jgi:hypothetical protein
MNKVSKKKIIICQDCGKKCEKIKCYFNLDNDVRVSCCINYVNKKI